MAVKLSNFEGLEVSQSSIEIPGAAGGLRDALKVDPVEKHKGDVIHVVLECEVQKIRHDSIDKDDLAGPQERVHILRVTNATLVDRELVAESLEAQAERIQQAKEIEGQQRMATTPPFLGFDDLTAEELCERVEQLAEDGDLDQIDRVLGYEEANGGRNKVLNACAAAQKVLAR